MVRFLDYALCFCIFIFFNSGFISLMMITSTAPNGTNTAALYNSRVG